MLLNYTPFTVEKLDGTHEQIALGRLTIRQLYLFAQKLAATDGPGLVQLATGKSAEWIDTLKPTAYGALHKQIIELNFPAATEIAKGDPRLAAQLMPFIQEVQVLSVIAVSAGMNLPAWSPAPAPSASAAATASASSTSSPST